MPPIFVSENPYCMFFSSKNQQWLFFIWKQTGKERTRTGRIEPEPMTIGKYLFCWSSP